jgi:CubicO group peptidase (beta-lactamase class C family)
MVPAMQASATIDAAGNATASGELGSIPWWSFTKTVLATAALRLAEEGALALDAPLASHAFTLRQVLRHETGLADYGGLAGYHAAVGRGQDPWDDDVMLERVERAFPARAAGDGWAYSNVGYFHLRKAIAAAGGAPIDAVVADLVFAKADVRDVRFAWERRDLRDVAMGEDVGYHPGWVYHGVVVGPLAQAARFLQALLSGAVLSDAMLAEMKTARALPELRAEPWLEPAYALGLMAPTVPGGRLYGHSGGGPHSVLAVYGRQVEGHEPGQGWAVGAEWRTGAKGSEVEAAVIDQLERLTR